MRSGYLLSRRATLLALSGVLLSMLLSSVNQTIVTTAVPLMVAEFGAVDQFAWVFTAYMVAMTVTTPLYGRLSDIHGRRPLFVVAILVFAVGTVMGGTAASMGQLIGARAVQGLGAGGLMPLGFAAIADLLPPSERGRWQGLIGGVLGVGTCAGPIAGGWIADYADWRWLFFASLPLAAVALVVLAATFKIPPHPERGTKVDYLGAALLTAGLSTGLLAILQGGRIAPALFAVSTGVLIALGWWERRVDQPIVPIEIFASRAFTLSACSAFLFAIGMFTAVQFSPLQLQGVLGASAATSGLVLTALMVPMVLVSIGSGQLVSRTGRYRWILAVAPIAAAPGYLQLALLDARSSVLNAAAAMALIGVGLGFFNQNVMLVAQNGVSSRYLGVATSTTHAMRSIGGLLGVAVMGAVVASGLPPGAEVAPAGGGGGLIAGAQLAAALHPVFLLIVPLMALTLAVVLLIPELPLRRTVREAPTAPVAVEPSSVA